MTDQLHLVQFPWPQSAIDAQQKVQRFIPIDEYRELFTHRLLTQTMGDLAPRPYRIIHANMLLGISAGSARDLKNIINETSLPSQAQTLNLEDAASKQLPETWTPHRLIDFEVKAIPTVRKKDAEGKRVESNVYQRSQEPSRTIAEVYTAWLETQFDKHDCAKLHSTSLAVSTLNRTRRSRHGAHRFPVAIFRGTLEVTNDQRFNAMLHRGIGNHIAYGYGMLLLTPHITSRPQ